MHRDKLKEFLIGPCLSFNSEVISVLSLWSCHIGGRGFCVWGCVWLQNVLEHNASLQTCVSSKTHERSVYRSLVYCAVSKTLRSPFRSFLENAWICCTFWIPFLSHVYFSFCNFNKEHSVCEYRERNVVLSSQISALWKVSEKHKTQQQRPCTYLAGWCVCFK